MRKWPNIHVQMSLKVAKRPRPILIAEKHDFNSCTSMGHIWLVQTIILLIPILLSCSFPVLKRRHFLSLMRHLWTVFYESDSVSDYRRSLLIPPMAFRTGCSILSWIYFRTAFTLLWTDDLLQRQSRSSLTNYDICLNDLASCYASNPCISIMMFSGRLL